MGSLINGAGFGNPTGIPLGFGSLAFLGAPDSPKVDRFGLPLYWNPLSESQEQRDERLQSAISLVFEVFTVATNHLGPRFARKVWRHAAKAKRGRPKGPSKPKLDEIMLAHFDELAADLDEKALKQLPRKMAAKLKRDYPDIFPVTEGAIEQRIRRLLKAREADGWARLDLAKALLKARGIDKNSD